jgi:hypothetical protein
MQMTLTNTFALEKKKGLSALNLEFAGGELPTILSCSTNFPRLKITGTKMDSYLIARLSAILWYGVRSHHALALTATERLEIGENLGQASKKVSSSDGNCVESQQTNFRNSSPCSQVLSELSGFQH